MSNLTFAIAGVQAANGAAVPTLNFRLHISTLPPASIHTIALRVQLQIQPRQRRHSPGEQERLLELFGEPRRWSETLRPLPWSQSSLIVPAFEASIEVDLPVVCTYDFEVIASKYLHALEQGEIHLLFLFSGTVFERSPDGFRVSQVAWDREAAFRMPAATWRDLMDAYFPGYTWIRLRRESLDSLQRFKARRALLNWDDAIRELTSALEEPVA